MNVTGGFRRYFYEYLIHQTLERVSDEAWDRGDGELSVRHRNFIREQIGQKLAEGGYDFNQEDLGYGPLVASMESAISEVYPNAGPVFKGFDQLGGRQENINAAFVEFSRAAGLGRDGAQGNPGGERLLVSPHDPRWANRLTVVNSGNRLVSIPGEVVDRYTEGHEDMRALTTVALPLHEAFPGEDGSDQLNELGTSLSIDDRAGLTALRPYMSENEYKAHRDWALQAARVDGGADGPKYDASVFMDRAARERAVAVLDDLASSGVDYEIVRDINPGQLKARVKGTGINVRVMDTSYNQAFVGAQVYDRGKTYTYSVTSTGDDTQKNRYIPSAKEAVDLVRFARGEDVLPQDGYPAPIGWPNAKGASYEGGPVERAYHNPHRNAMFTVGTVSNAAVPEQNGRPLRIQVKAPTAMTDYVADQEAAERKLRGWIDAAQISVSTSLNIEEMYAMAIDPERAEEEPVFSSNEDLAEIQQRYWSQLVQYRGGVDENAPEAEPLLLPGVTMREYRQAQQAGDVQALSEMATTTGYNAQLETTVPVEPIDAVRKHAGAYVLATVGQYDIAEDGKRFNPIEVARHMDSGAQMLSNRDNIVAALRVSDIKADELRGDDFNNDVIAERMISFDPSSSVPISEHEDPLMRSFGQTIAKSIYKSGAEVAMSEVDGKKVPNIFVDDKGVVQWQAERRVGMYDQDEGKNMRMVTGEIGQILVPGKHGEITTKFGHGKNYMFVPGYLASVVPQAPGEVKSVEERTKLRSYEQMMHETIGYTVRNNLMTHRSEVGEPTALNTVYRGLYGHKLPENYTELTAEEGMSPELRDSVLDTMGRRVRYTKDIADGASLRSKLFATRHGKDFLNDNTRDALSLTVGRDMTTLSGDIGSGYYDPEMTGTAYNHGAVRYLAESATVGPDGFMVKGEEGDRAPLMKESWLKNIQFNQHSRRNMMLGAVLQASAITPGTSVAMTELKGWNFEDGIVVSKEYAESHMIRATDGEMRPLKVGDKLSDLHGNKGVISLVVDPEMTPEEAAEQSLTEEVALFRDNEGLDVVMSPFSFISRQNGGSARDLMDSSGKGARDLIVGDKVVEGGIGETNIVITHMAVDAKTNIYDAEAMREGKGRKASSQLAWAVQSQDCPELMNYFYGDNDAGVAKSREFLVSLGFDMLPDGTLQKGYNTEVSPEREVIEMGEPLLSKTRGTIGKNEVKRMRSDIGQRLGETGGVMEIPFEVTLSSGEVTPQIGVDEVTGRPRYGLPVLSASLRSEQELADGTVSTHDHTMKYTDIYIASMRYEHEMNQIDPSTSERDRQRILGRAQDQVRSAQGNYDALANEIINHKIESKNNIFRNQIMSTRVDHSATAVWTADPRLSINQVAMNSEMARELGVTRNKGQDCLNENSVGHTLLWRDPVWRDSGLRYMEVVIDDNLEGVAINPVVASSFDGDFDGDAVGLVSNLPSSVHKEAVEKLSMEMNTLDLGQGVQQEDGTMRYPLSTAHEQDTVLATAKDPELAALYEEIVDNAHDNLVEYRAGEIDFNSYRETNKAVLDDLNSFYQQALSTQYGDAAVSFKDLDSHLKSVANSFQRVDERTGEVIEHGAKGSAGKLAEYAQQVGAEAGDDGRWLDRGTPLVDDATREAEQIAMGIKTESVGDAGTKSHMAVRLLRKQGLIREAAHISYGATQSILQAKKDPIDAIYREKIVSENISDQWSGYLLRSGEDEHGKYTWERVYGEDGEPQLATKDQWVEQYMEMYTSKKGMGVPVSRDMVEVVAQSLSDEHGVMHNLDKSNWKDLPAAIRPTTMDHLAYSGKLDDLKELSEEGANLFEGPNEQFATKTIQDNRRIMSAEIEGAPVHQIDVKDTRVLEANTGRTLSAAREQTALPARESASEQQAAAMATAAFMSAGKAKHPDFAHNRFAASQSRAREGNEGLDF